MKIAEIEFDGGCNGNVGTFGYIVKANKKEWEGNGKVEKEGMTNNVAEYLGLLKAVQRLKKEVGIVTGKQIGRASCRERVSSPV